MGNLAQKASNNNQSVDYDSFRMLKLFLLIHYLFELKNNLLIYHDSCS